MVLPARETFATDLHRLCLRDRAARRGDPVALRGHDAIARARPRTDRDERGATGVEPCRELEHRGCGSGARRPLAATVVAALGDSLSDPRSSGRKVPRLPARALSKVAASTATAKAATWSIRCGAGSPSDVFGGNADAALARVDYTHVIVFGGVNDLLSDKTAGRTPRKISDDLAAIYAAAREHGARVIAITVAPWGGNPEYNPSRAAATREVNRFINEQLAAARSTTSSIRAAALLRQSRAALRPFRRAFQGWPALRIRGSPGARRSAVPAGVQRL